MLSVHAALHVLPSMSLILLQITLFPFAASCSPQSSPFSTNRQPKMYHSIFLLAFLYHLASTLALHLPPPNPALFSPIPIYLPATECVHILNPPLPALNPSTCDASIKTAYRLLIRAIFCEPSAHQTIRNEWTWTTAPSHTGCSVRW